MRNEKREIKTKKYMTVKDNAENVGLSILSNKTYIPLHIHIHTKIDTCMVACLQRTTLGCRTLFGTFAFLFLFCILFHF